jgi:hexosaminidase
MVCGLDYFFDAMRRQTLLAATALLAAQSFVRAEEPPLIPRPAQISARPNVFKITDQTTIAVEFEFRDVGALFEERLRTASGLPLENSKVSEFRRNVIALRRDQTGRISPGGYTIEVDSEEAAVHAADAAGAFYGTQTLLQLLPPEVYVREAPRLVQDVTKKKRHVTDSNVASKLTGIHWEIPVVNIADAPRWEWRGVMLDVSGHFFPKKTVEQLIDWMAWHKLNRLRLRLAGDAGWRLEIKKYPALTKEGATGNATDPQAAPAFFTQKDIREIVGYASERQIVVVPEVSLPEHAAAVIRAMPELGGAHGRLNTSLPQVQTFAEDVLTTVMELFPSRWIHFGGGEALRTGDDDEEATAGPADAAFSKRLSVFIKKHGRIPAEGAGVAGAEADPDSVIYWFDGDNPDALKTALEQGHHVVLCPRSPCFFDYPQDPLYPADRSNIRNTLEAVYRGPKIPADIPADRLQQILGSEACVWTDHISTEPYLQFKLVPRLFAFAEMAWTPDERRDFSSFMAREKKFTPLYEMLHLSRYDLDNPVESLRKAIIKEPNPADKVSLPPSATKPALRY